MVRDEDMKLYNYLSNVYFLFFLCTAVLERSFESLEVWRSGVLIALGDTYYVPMRRFD